MLSFIQSDSFPQSDFLLQNLLVLILILALVDQLTVQQKADRPGEREIEFESGQFR